MSASLPTSGFASRMCQGALSNFIRVAVGQDDVDVLIAVSIARFSSKPYSMEITSVRSPGFLEGLILYVIQRS